jgi:4-hydroxy-tetrahydrodipicolinate synthase
MDQVSVPCILYNIPGRTGCAISERNLSRLVEHPNAWAIKEASGSITYATMCAQYLSSDFRMFSGNDDIVVPLMSLGASGVISVWANVAPRTVHDLCANWLAGNTAAALRTQIDNLELIHSLFCEVNPIPVKAAMAKMGLIRPVYRQPLWPMEEKNEARLEMAMREVGLLG